MPFCYRQGCDAPVLSSVCLVTFFPPQLCGLPERHRGGRICQGHRGLAQPAAQPGGLEELTPSACWAASCPLGSYPSDAFIPPPLPALPLQISLENIARADIAPMLEVQLELVGSEVVWVPEVGDSTAGSSSGSGSARDLAHRWVQGFFEAASLMKRLDTGEGGRAVEGGSGACCAVASRPEKRGRCGASAPSPPSALAHPPLHNHPDHQVPTPRSWRRTCECGRRSAR